MAITAEQVKALRDITGAGMMDCKKALVETDGDAKAAEKLLKERGLAAVEKRTDRATGEGVLVIKGDDKKIAFAELLCETDFVAKNADFIQVAQQVAEMVFNSEVNEASEEQKALVLDLATRVRENMSVHRVACIKADAHSTLGHYVHHDKRTAAAIVVSSDNPDAFANEEVKKFVHDCCLHIVAYTPSYLRQEDVAASYIEEQRALFTKQVETLDKPENVKKGIVEGKIKKHFSEICFLDQPFVDNEKISVNAAMTEVGKKAGATLKIEKIYLWKVGENA
ncbi:MAG: translation elongation factor Ts [Spirochaetaceae bacterium]|nr:translation elongation factor Ts [Spirochaetaceae bacterium]